MLHGRRSETAFIDAQLGLARDGGSAAVVLRGEPGAGKSALLDYAATAGKDMTVIRATGVEVEAELPYAALQMLLRPIMDSLGALPGPQAVALKGALGLETVSEVNRFAVGLATLTLLSEAAGPRPVLCLVDDAQWLDRASADAIRFAARRLDADRIAMILAARPHSPDLPIGGLPELEVAGLDRDAAMALLADSPLPSATRSRIIAETEGNPLAITELAKHRVKLGEDSGHQLRYPRNVRDAFISDVEQCDEDTRNLLLVAAVAGTSDLDIVNRVCADLGIDDSAIETAADTQLIEVDADQIRFRHPLIRSAIYQAAPVAKRRSVHRALSLAYDEVTDPDRRAWHAAAATTGTDAVIAQQLMDSAHRASARGGQADAVSIVVRAAELTDDPGLRAARLIVAAEAAGDSGQAERAMELAGEAAELTEDPMAAAQITELRAESEILAGSVAKAYELLIDGASAVSGADPDRAVILLTHVVDAGIHAGNPDWIGRATALMGGIDLADDSRLPSAVAACAGLADVLAGDPAAGIDRIREFAAAMGRIRGHLTGARKFAATLAGFAGDFDLAADMAELLVEECRAGGMAGWLPTIHSVLCDALARTGRFRDARVSAGEGLAIAEDLGQARMAAALNAVSAWLAAVSGDEIKDRPIAAGDMSAWAMATLEWAHAMRDMAEGRFAAAADRWDAAMDGSARDTVVALNWAPDQVEAAVRAGSPQRAHAALARFTPWAIANGREHFAAVLARCRALTGPPEHAGDRFAEAMELHARDARPFEAARTALLYGEWLRRKRRKSAARAQLRAAMEGFARLGARPWAERARLELRATGETRIDRAANPDLRDQLTPQELQVVKLAAAGASNRDIGAQLFLSPRTVGHHLYKAYPKLGVANRGELAALFAATAP